MTYDEYQKIAIKIENAFEDLEDYVSEALDTIDESTKINIIENNWCECKLLVEKVKELVDDE